MIKIDVYVHPFQVEKKKRVSNKKEKTIIQGYGNLTFSEITTTLLNRIRRLEDELEKKLKLNKELKESRN